MEHALSELEARWGRLREQLANLRLTIAEDRPLDRDLSLVDRRADAVDDLLGLVDDGVSAVRAARLARDAEAFGRALLTAHQRQQTLIEHLWNDLLSFDRVHELRQTARRYGGEWAPWARRIESDLRALPHGACAIGLAIGAAWLASTARWHVDGSVGATEAASER